MVLVVACSYFSFLFYQTKARTEDIVHRTSNSSSTKLAILYPPVNDEQNSVLESTATREEIRIAVWGCGEDKSPGPDGFTFEFFRMLINIHKSHLLGIGVSDVLNLMERMRMNVFNGVQEGERKIAWVKWSKVLASKKFGGLGVSSFFAFNRALIFKW
nr:RNA-directed DNA polymerase, eukaryota, reverse transcriptase zinc-binding domain protein [Tanacetum cinerariifolium]